MSRHDLRHPLSGQFVPRKQATPRTTLMMVAAVATAKRNIRSVGRGAPQAPLQKGHRTEIPDGTPRWRGTDHRI